MATRTQMIRFAYRRLRWPLGMFVAVGLVLAWAVFGGGDPDFVLYNKSSRPLQPARVVAGDVTVDFPALEPGRSAVQVLPLQGGQAVILWLSGDPPRSVTGPWVEPKETAQVVARVSSNGEVLFSLVPSWRSRVAAVLR
jgi:hypothetical protein